jgi:hypothetical protein
LGGLDHLSKNTREAKEQAIFSIIKKAKKEHPELELTHSPETLVGGQDILLAELALGAYYEQKVDLSFLEVGQMILKFGSQTDMVKEARHRFDMVSFYALYSEDERKSKEDEETDDTDLLDREADLTQDESESDDFGDDDVD